MLYKTIISHTVYIILMLCYNLCQSQDSKCHLAITSSGFETFQSDNNKCSAIIGQPVIGIISSNNFHSGIGFLYVQLTQPISDIFEWTLASVDIMNLYPNPSENYINITFGYKSQSKLILKTTQRLYSFKLIITNYQGQPMYQRDIQISMFNNEQLCISTKDFPAGIYFVRLLSDNDCIVKSFIKY
jgi:hypothetical protein